MNRFDAYTVKQVDSTVYPGKYFVPDHACAIKEAIESQKFPEGTVVEITIPAQEDKIILPDGMEWKDHVVGVKKLWTKDGLEVATSYSVGTGSFGTGSYAIPFETRTKCMGPEPTQEAVQRAIVELFAQKGWHGVRKIRTCEEKHTYKVWEGDFADKTLRAFKESCWTSLFTQFSASGYPEGTTVKITYPEIKPEPEVVYPEGARWGEEGYLYSGEGACIGWVIDTVDVGYCRPYTDPDYPSYCHENMPDYKKARDWVVRQLAERRHYGFRFKGEG